MILSFCFRRWQAPPVLLYIAEKRNSRLTLPAEAGGRPERRPKIHETQNDGGNDHHHREITLTTNLFSANL